MSVYFNHLGVWKMRNMMTVTIKITCKNIICTKRRRTKEKTKKNKRKKRKKRKRRKKEKRKKMTERLHSFLCWLALLLRDSETQKQNQNSQTPKQNQAKNQNKSLNHLIRNPDRDPAVHNFQFKKKTVLTVLTLTKRTLIISVLPGFVGEIATFV